MFVLYSSLCRLIFSNFFIAWIPSRLTRVRIWFKLISILSRFLFIKGLMLFKLEHSSKEIYFNPLIFSIPLIFSMFLQKSRFNFLSELQFSKKSIFLMKWFSLRSSFSSFSNFDKFGKAFTSIFNSTIEFLISSAITQSFGALVITLIRA